MTKKQSEALYQFKFRDVAANNASMRKRFTGYGRLVTKQGDAAGMGGDVSRAREVISERIQRVTAWHAAGCPDPKPNWNEG